MSYFIALEVPWSEYIATKKSIGLSQLVGDSSIESMDASGLRPMKDSGQASEQLAIVSCARDSWFREGP